MDWFVMSVLLHLYRFNVAVLLCYSVSSVTLGSHNQLKLCKGLKTRSKFSVSNFYRYNNKRPCIQSQQPFFLSTGYYCSLYSTIKCKTVSYKKNAWKTHLYETRDENLFWGNKGRLFTHESQEVHKQASIWKHKSRQRKEDLRIQMHSQKSRLLQSVNSVSLVGLFQIPHAKQSCPLSTKSKQARSYSVRRTQNHKYAHKRCAAWTHGVCFGSLL